MSLLKINRLSLFRLSYLLVCLTGIGLSTGDRIFAQSSDQLWQHRNLGKAFYENSATQYEAVGEFKKALDMVPDSARERINYGLSLLRAGQEAAGIAELEQAQKQDPSIPHTWFNLGIAYKRAARYDEAIQQFERMVALVPDEPISHYNLGVLYKLNSRNEDAIRHFQQSADLDPNLAGPHFQLATAFRQAGRTDDFKTEMATFRRIKAEQAGAAVPEDLEWSFYSEIYETIDPTAVRNTGPAAPLSFDTAVLARNAGMTGLHIIDADADGQDDLLTWSAQGMTLYRQGGTAATSGLENVKGVKAAAATDIDNDGQIDLCLITASGAVLYRNDAGRFSRHTANLPAGAYHHALWLDYDHDYDPDLFLLGARSVLMRNNGDAGFSDQTASFPFVSGEALAGVRIDLIADTQGMDIAVTYADRPGVLYRDFLAGKYEARTLSALTQGLDAITAFDFNNDGWTDLAAGNARSLVLLMNDQKAGLQQMPAPAGAKGAPAFADLENRTASELIADGRVYRNRGLGAFAAADYTVTPEPVALAVADFNADGRSDMATITPGGGVAVRRNTTGGANHWLRISLEGVKNPKLAPGAEVEVKAGIRYQKKIYDGRPLLFGLASYAQVDAVRITWPNGLIQNETQQAAGQSVSYKEAQRLSGSCPMIFTWNGTSFEFITDVLGVAPLGASAGDGQYFPVDHDEYIQIPGEALVPNNDGYYEIRITEELREIAYLDEIQLIAVDHPQENDVFINDKFKGPPFPEFRLFGVEDRRYPVSVRDHEGRDVREKVLARDRTYPDAFERDYAGVAEPHTLTLDFDTMPDDRAILVMSGWVDWADGSTFLGHAQASTEGLVMPYLQVKNSAGVWETVIEDMGLPAGKPKTIVVDLSGKFLSDDRQVRIVTSLCVYWDEIFMSTDYASWPRTPVDDGVRMTTMHADSASLQFRGFSGVDIHPQRLQPEAFIYSIKKPTTMWNPTPGLYTRYGDVRMLLESTDDRYIIMGSGDEVRLLFDAGQAPALKPGWRRDYLLFVDGWAKDGDANTAFSQSVEPLPYHDMPQYPYDEPHHFPQDGPHNLYREFYNTRPALRLIRPLNEEADRALAGQAVQK